MSQRRAMGSLEREVLSCLWKRPEGSTPAEVLDALGDDLAYTTITTILTRLWEKGLVERERAGRAYVYRSTHTEADLAAERMGAVLDQSQDRRAALTQFVSTLSSRDARVVRALLESGQR